MTEDTRLTLRRAPVPTPGAVSLVFGEKEGVSLVFSRVPVVTPGPVRLVFGDDGVAPPAIDDATLTAAARVTGLRGSIAVLASASVQVSGVITGLSGTIPARVAVTVHAAGTIIGLRLRIATVYNVNVSRPTVGQAAARYQQARTAQVGAQGLYQQALPLASGAQANWQDAEKVQALLRAAWQESERLQVWARVAYQQAIALATSPTLQSWQEAQRVRSGSAVRFQEAVRLPTVPNSQRFQEGVHLRSGGVQRFQEAQPLSASAVQWTGYGLPVRAALGARYQEAWPPRPGIWLRPVDPVDPGEKCYDPALPARLVFFEPADSTLPARLVFKCDNAGPGPEPGATVVVPIRKLYMTLNNVTLIRVDGAVPIPAYSFGMSIDVDSWTWQWQATLHADALALIQPNANGDPVDVLATISGTPYRLAVENFSRQRQFAQTRITVKGRGRAAILDAPYAPVGNHGNAAAARTAQQLMQDVLTVNGVGIGWHVDWRLTDWLVPAGAWAHQGSYISAILDIAGAAGGYVQPHNTLPTLRVLPRYPAAPWQWGTLTPDFELPSAVVSVEGIDWQRKAAYDRVFVSGANASGVLGQVTRGGTAGGSVAPMVTHPLITHADAARQRGIAELGDTGRQAHISLRLPVLPETGVIQPGALVRYVDGGDTHLGLVRGTSVDWSRPTLRQTLSVETHPA